MLKRLFLVFPVAFFVFCLASSGVSQAGEISSQIKSSVDKILVLLKDPALKAPAKRLERRDKIFKVVNERFDFAEMSKRSMGGYWPKLSSGEREEFVNAFSHLLQNTYITKIERYSDEKVVISAEKPRGDNVYSVHSEIVSSGGRPIAVDYSVYKASDGQWRVYDVNIEGVSLVTNYRSQFREVMPEEGFHGLMIRINEKLQRPQEN